MNNFIYIYSIYSVTYNFTYALNYFSCKQQDAWEATHRHLLNFIQTKTKPHIFYLPKKHNSKTEERLTVSQKVITSK